MACAEQILASILIDCDNRAKGGMERKAWVFNGDEVTFTVDPTNPVLLTGFTVASTKQSYIIEGFKNSMDAGNDLVTSENNLDRYNHYFSALVQARTADEVNNIASMNGLIIVIEAKDKGANDEGAFEVYGKETRLYKSSETRRINAEAGRFNLQFENIPEQESSVPHHVLLETDYATTLASLVASETPAP